MSPPREFQYVARIIERILRGQALGDISLHGPTLEFSDVVTAFQLLRRPELWQDGSAIHQLERLFADYLGVRHAYSFLGGRVSLSAILEALELGEEDEVILPGYTCVVVPNALLYRGIRPVYVDIDPFTFNLTFAEIERLVTCRTRAVIIQHTFGLVGDLDPILETARRHNLFVIEDCAPALGAEYKGKKVGTLGDAAYFSMEQSKVISTQMGGVAVTNDEGLGQRLKDIQVRAAFPEPEEIKIRLWRFIYNYLISRPKFGLISGGLFLYLTQLLGKQIDIVSTTAQEVASIQPRGYGKRLPNALAALGIRQLKNLDVYNQRRRESASQYDQWIRNCGGQPIPVLPDTKPVYLRYPVYVQDKGEFSHAMREFGIQPGVWFTDAIHPKGSDWCKLGYTGGQCPNAEFAVKHLANLPCGFPTNGLNWKKMPLEKLLYFGKVEDG